MGPIRDEAEALAVQKRLGVLLVDHIANCGVCTHVVDCTNCDPCPLRVAYERSVSAAAVLAETAKVVDGCGTEG